MGLDDIFDLGEGRVLQGLPDRRCPVNNFPVVSCCCGGLAGGVGRGGAERGGYHGALVKRTFVMCKPDAVERGLAGEVLARLERKGLTLVAAELRTLDRATAEAHYAEHAGKGFYEELVSFITRSPVLAMVVEGPDDNTWHLVRTL